jgi:hypothetical protein
MKPAQVQFLVEDLSVCEAAKVGVHICESEQSALEA